MHDKFLDHTKLLLDGVRSVVEDEGFQFSSSPAVKALDAATSLLEWITGCEANRAIAAKFSSDLVSYLLRCFPAVGSKLDRVKMWHKFHMIRTSKDFFLLWDKFLKASIKKGGPIFLQHVTSQMFKQLIKTNYPLQTECNDASSECVTLSHLEKNVLRYVAGYIPRNLLKKIGR